MLAEEGLSLFDQKDYAGALERFDKADALISVPTVDLFAARCLAQLGRLLDASERYLEVANVELTDDAPPAFKSAKVDAKTERDALLPRLAALAVTIEGGPEGAAVSIDGKEVDAGGLAEPRPLDPGSHRVEGKRAGAAVTEEVTLAEGEKKTVTLKLPKPKPPPPPLPPQPFEGSGRALRTVGVIGLIAGGAGLATWGVTGGIALAKQGDLEENGCIDGHCPAWSRPGSYSGLRLASTIGLYSGIGLATAGALFFLLAPSPPKKAGAGTFEPWIGAGSAGVRGAF